MDSSVDANDMLESMAEQVRELSVKLAATQAGNRSLQRQVATLTQQLQEATAEPAEKSTNEVAPTE